MNTAKKAISLIVNRFRFIKAIHYFIFITKERCAFSIVHCALCIVNCFLVLTVSCNDLPKIKSDSQNTQKTQSVKQPVFNTVIIPDGLTSDSERAEYYVKHYWDSMNFKDTTFLSYTGVLEQAFVNYAHALSYVPAEISINSLKNMMGKASVDRKMFTFLFDLSEKYLYNPKSDLENEDLFIIVLESAINSTVLDEIRKVRPKKMYDLALKNRIGTKALDFSYTLADGHTSLMHDIKSEYLLLMFYTPGCEQCGEMMNKLKIAPKTNYYINGKRLTILAVYPGEQYDEWKAYVKNMPSSWINGYDKNIYVKNEDIYDLKAIPAVYLLDKEKNVIIKNASAELIETYFLNI